MLRAEWIGFLSPDFPIRECKIPDACNYSSNNNTVPSFYMFSVRPPHSHLSSVSLILSWQQGVGTNQERLGGAALQPSCFLQPLPLPSLPRSSCLTQCHQGFVVAFCFIGILSSYQVIHHILKGKITGVLNLEVTAPESSSALLPPLPP